MLKNLRTKIAKAIAPEYVAVVLDLEKRVSGIEDNVNQRIAKTLIDLDPMELVMKKYHGVFGGDFEHPEEKLDQASKLGMYMFGYQMRNDKYFKFLTQWAKDTQGNNTIRKAKNDHEWFFGRACLVMIEVFVSEINRLANNYDEIMNKDKQDFNDEKTVE